MSKYTFEDFLMEKHAENYIGTKDCMVDDFNDWLTTKDMDIIINYGDEFAKQQSKELLEALQTIKGDGDFTYETEYVGQMFQICMFCDCSGVSAIKHDKDCGLEKAEQAIAKAEGVISGLPNNR